MTILDESSHETWMHTAWPKRIDRITGHMLSAWRNTVRRRGPRRERTRTMRRDKKCWDIL